MALNSLKLKRKIIEWDDMNKRRFVPFYGLLQLGIRATTHPYNLIKTRLMDKYSLSLYNGTVDCFFKVIKYEGFPAIYKGFSVQCLHVGTTLLYITTYTYTRKIVDRSRHNLSDFTLSAISGGVAAFTCQLIGVPIDVISQYMMVNRTAAHLTESPWIEEAKTLPKLCQDIHHNRGGLPAFYKGFLASILTFVPNSVLLWGLYSLYTSTLMSYAPSDVPLFAIQACAGPLAALCSAPLSHPLDIVRVRLQLHQSVTIRAAFKDIYESQGLRGFTRGLVARTLANTQGSVIVFLCYETVKRFSLKDERKSQIL
ncbi:solute carrier family 25 member 44-like [Glandiceps talaboti]